MGTEDPTPIRQEETVCFLHVWAWLGTPTPTQLKPIWMSGRIPERSGIHPRYIADSSTLRPQGLGGCWNWRCIEDVSQIYQGFGLTSKSVWVESVSAAQSLGVTSWW